MGTISDEYMGRNDPYKKPVVSTEELDEKLRAIKLQRKEQLANGKVEFEYFLSSSEIARIKAVFAERHTINGLDFANATKFMNMRTGAEWYARYEIEKGQGSLDNLKDLPHSTDYANGIDHAVIKCDEAARRAAGIEDSDVQ